MLEIMQKVAITGASGFVGKKLIIELVRSGGYKIVVFDSKTNSLFRPKTLQSLISGCDIIYHLAAINDPKGQGIIKTNILGVWGVLEAIRRYAPNSKLVFTSSFAVYKNPKLGDVVDEKFKKYPRNIYGFTKLIGEIICIFYSKVFRIKVSIVRISNIYGPGMPPFRHSVISTFIEKIKKGENLEISGNGEQTRDFIYIDDVVKALISVGLSKSKFDIFNICSGREISINTLTHLISGRLNKNIKISYFSGSNNEGYWKGSNQKVKKRFGWSPEISLEEGLKKMV